jgi:hypothetical protein
LDGTNITVTLKHERYEGSEVVTEAGGYKRGSNLESLRRVVGDGGVIEEIRRGSSAEQHLELSRDMILHSPALKEGDILSKNRGFLSWDILNRLKRERGVDLVCVYLGMSDLNSARIRFLLE